MIGKTTISFFDYFLTRFQRLSNIMVISMINLLLYILLPTNIWNI